MEDMQAGNIDYDRVIATPDMMGVVGRLARSRPQGPDAQPQARHGDPERRPGGQGRQGGQVEFRVEKQGIIHRASAS